MSGGVLAPLVVEAEDPELTDEDVLRILTAGSLEEARAELLDLCRRERRLERETCAAQLDELHADLLAEGHHGTTLQLLGEAARFVRTLIRIPKRRRRTSP